jgi:hypothetical protein
MMGRNAYLLIAFICLSGCEKDETDSGSLTLVHAFVGSVEISLDGPITSEVPIDQSITLVFSSSVKEPNSPNSIVLSKDGQPVNITNTFQPQDNSVVIFPDGLLSHNTMYTIKLSAQLRGSKGESFASREVGFKTALVNLQIDSLEFGDEIVKGNSRIVDVPLNLSTTIYFSAPVNTGLFEDALHLDGPDAPPLQISFSNNDKTVTFTSASSLKDLSKFTLTVSGSLKGAKGENFAEYTKVFYTTVASAPKFPIIPDGDLLTKVQQQTFKYFYNFAHPVSGMARERNTSGNIITSGGSGFGIMALIVGMERNFITRTEGLSRMKKIVSFLETAERFHGVWPHWMDGNTGKVIPFSANDNGGDLVETSFLLQGLLTFRQYLNNGVPEESDLINRINLLWHDVEWDWYRKCDPDCKNVLYWHWSPDKGWIMNFALSGYFEEQITYVLAAASPTHSIPKIVYANGFAQNGAIVRNETYYGYPIKLGGLFPLFWVQYSYLGLAPHFSDAYANYWDQNVNASLINYQYCKTNPKNFAGYSDECWGLTASDNQDGYSAHSPGNDLGVITPSAALSSFPYTPDESMEALKFFYYKMGDRLWGEYGFYDAFDITNGWVASSYLAIDQGPIIIMIENYRSGLLWNLFMSAPEVQVGIDKLDFNY